MSHPDAHSPFKKSYIGEIWLKLMPKTNLKKNLETKSSKVSKTQPRDMADSYRPLATPCEKAVLTQKHQQLALSPSVVPVFTSIPT